MLFDTRNHLGSHSGIRQVTDCIQTAVLQVGPNFVPENLQVIVPFELWVKTFDGWARDFCAVPTELLRY